MFFGEGVFVRVVFISKEMFQYVDEMLIGVEVREVKVIGVKSVHVCCYDRFVCLFFARKY